MKSKLAGVLLAVVLGAGVYTAVVLATPSTGQGTTTLAKATVGALDLSAKWPITVVGDNGKTHDQGLWQAWLKTHGDSDLYVIDNKFQPATATTPLGTSGWHSHPGPSIIFVVAGTITNYLSDDPTCTPHVYTVGQSFVDAGGDDAHILRNEGTTVAETIAVQFLPRGEARKIDEPSPGNCSF
jgi:hypothetical protein